MHFQRNFPGPIAEQMLWLGTFTGSPRTPPATPASILKPTRPPNSSGIPPGFSTPTALVTEDCIRPVTP